MTMRAVIFNGVNRVRMEDMPVPVPGPGEACLKVALAGVCATDRHIVSGHFAVRPPRVLGHELTGVVDAVGQGVAAEWLGQSCAVRPARFCGRCAMCLSDAPQLCQNFECLGNTHNGGYAEYTLAKVDQLIPLNGLTFEEAVWLEPLACVLQSLQQIGLAAFSGPVLILGAGVLGRLMIQAIHAVAPNSLAVIDPNPAKIQLALALGAQAGWPAPRSGEAAEAARELRAWAPDGPAAVIDTSGAPEAIRRAVEWAGPRAKVLLFGVSGPAATACIAPHHLFSKELTLQASSGMSPASFDAALDLLRSGRINLQAQETVTIGLEDLPAQLLGKAGPAFAKLLVRTGALEEAQR